MDFELSQDQKLLASDQHGTRAQRVERGEIVGAKRGGDLGRDPVGQRINCFRLDDDLLGKRARARPSHHAHAGLISAGCTGRVRHHLVTRRREQAHARRVLAGARSGKGSG